MKSSMVNIRSPRKLKPAWTPSSPPIHLLKKCTAHNGPLVKGTATIIYSDYKVNTGLSDEIFKKKEENGKR